MTIEISRDLQWIYRISPNDSTIIERRSSKRNSRWVWYLRRDSANEAKSALLNLGKEEGE